MELNQTPIRTSKSYGINNFNIPNSALNHKFQAFENLEVVNAKFAEISSLNNVQVGLPLSENIYEENKNPNQSLHIKIKQSQDEPIVLNFKFNSKNSVLIDSILIEVSKGAKASVVVNYLGKTQVYHNGFIKTSLSANSALDIAIISNVASGTNLINLENNLEKDAKLNQKVVDFGINYSVLHNFTNVVGNNAKSDFKLLYFGTDSNKLDFNIIQNIYGENCDAKIEAVGALFKCAEKNFKGTINFKKGCIKSNGNESELCMLLSNKAKSKALPILLCEEENVNGNHSTAVGKIGEKELFYIMSRGLNIKEARKLILSAKFNCVLKGASEELKNDIIKNLNGKIENED